MTATTPPRWWAGLPFCSTAPADVPMTPEVEPAVIHGDPALDLLVERVCYATSGLVDISRDDLSILVHEACWQVGHLVRQGCIVEVPHIGTLKRHVVKGYTQIHCTPDPDLLEVNDA